MTLDDISGGRIISGIRAVATTLKCSPTTISRPSCRSVRFQEFVTLTDQLLRRIPVTHKGSFYRCDDLIFTPACVRQPRSPIAIAAAGPRRDAADGAGCRSWVTSGRPNGFTLKPWQDVTALIKQQLIDLDKACVAAGRDPSTLARLLLTGASIGGLLESVAAFTDAAGTFAELGITDLVVHWPRPQFPFQADMTRCLRR